MPAERSARRDHVERGTKGVAGRVVGGSPDAAAGRATLRSALKRVGAKPKPAAGREAGDPAKRTARAARRAAQAALGMVGQPPSSLDEAALRQWLARMAPEQLRKLEFLLRAARQERPRPAPGLDRVEREMGKHGISFDVRAGSVTVNIGAGPQQGGGRRYSSPRRPAGGDWGRPLARIRDFINGR